MAKVLELQLQLQSFQCDGGDSNEEEDDRNVLIRVVMMTILVFIEHILNAKSSCQNLTCLISPVPQNKTCELGTTVASVYR